TSSQGYGTLKGVYGGTPRGKGHLFYLHRHRGILNPVLEHQTTEQEEEQVGNRVKNRSASWGEASINNVHPDMLKVKKDMGTGEH
ncbi:unnamed protein product, partial [marine sediment metagenome]